MLKKISNILSDSGNDNTTSPHKGLWKLREMFPELTETEFLVLMHYACGTDNESVADILSFSVSSVKQAQKRIKEKLHLTKLESTRGIYNARTQTALMVKNDFPGNYYETTHKLNNQPQI